MAARGTKVLRKEAIFDELNGLYLIPKFSSMFFWGKKELKRKKKNKKQEKFSLKTVLLSYLRDKEYIVHKC